MCFWAESPRDSKIVLKLLPLRTIKRIDEANDYTADTCDSKIRDLLGEGV